MQINEYIDFLEKNESSVFHLLENIDSKDAEKKNGDSWSVLNILEHVLLTERLVLSILLKSSNSTSNQEEIFGREKLTRLIVSLRNRKIKAPELLEPKGNIKSIEQFSQKFFEQRSKFKTDLLEGKITISNAIFIHPFLGEMTIIDWLNFIPLHCERHLEQIKDNLKK